MSVLLLHLLSLLPSFFVKNVTVKINKQIKTTAAIGI